ncbi:MAG: hypothetical protein ACYDHQ_10405 [Coriobacteriia bacterium]
MRIESARLDNRRRAFVLVTERGSFSYPYTKADPAPTPADRVVDLRIDEEMAGEAIVYRLSSGREGFVHVEMALDYNREPSYMRDLFLHQLTVEALRAFEQSGLAKREVIRRLGTSPAQLYRLLDPADYSKSVDKMLELLSVLGCDIEFSVRPRSA